MLELKRRPVTGLALKYIAMISMLCDHANLLVIRRGLFLPFLSPEGYLNFATAPAWLETVSVCQSVFDVLGHMAFPIYVFLLTEGFLHTRNRLRYLLTLLGFALLSEPVYNFAHYGALTGPALQNVLFTLTVACAQLWVLSAIEAKGFAPGKGWTLRVLTVAAAAGFAFIIRSEYVFLGTLAAALFYLLRGCGVWRVCGLLPLVVVSPWILLDAPLLLLYGGRRGGGATRFGKYFFYIFYPVHFLVLLGIGKLLASLAV